MSQDAPKKKQVTVTLTEEVTRDLLDTAKHRMNVNGGDPQAIFLAELQDRIAKEGLEKLVSGIDTSTKFADVISAGN